jgi:esterase/lipase
MARPTLVIIPGIGDRSWAYGVFAWIWHLHGFDVHVIPFGWADYHADITAKTQNFMQQLARVDSRKLYIVGVSAGGPAAVNVYAGHAAVERIAVVAAPLERFQHAIENQLLDKSITRAQAELDAFSDKQKSRILSAYGLYDQVVPVRMSNPGGVRRTRVWMVWHAFIIFAGMTFGSFRLSRFLKTGK